MAGDWIKFELCTLDKPEVIRMSRELGISKEAVCGYLIRFWGWYSANSTDGNVANVSPADIDVVLALPGFSEALKVAGWLKEGPNNSLHVPNFEYHNSESAKKRALKTRQKQKERSRDIGDNKATSKRPEKRREEIKDKTLPPDGGSTIWDFGRSLLIEQGLSSQSAGALLGSWLREWSEADVAEALRLSAGKADIRSYAAAILKAKPKKSAPPTGKVVAL